MRTYQSLRCAAVVGRAVSVQRRFAAVRGVSAVVVQSRVRGYLVHTRFSKARNAATAIQRTASRSACMKCAKYFDGDMIYLYVLCDMIYFLVV